MVSWRGNCANSSNRAGEAALALQDTAAAGVDYLVTGDVELHPTTERWLGITKVSVRRVSDLSRQKHEHTIRVGMVGPTEIARSIHAELEEAFGDRIMSHCFLGGDVSILEVFDPSVSKWEGILHVARRHDVKPEEIIAIGDGVNDVTMVRNAGLGVAMGNSHKGLLKCAAKVIGRNSDDGLALFLEDLLATGAVEPARRN